MSKLNGDRRLLRGNGFGGLASATDGNGDGTGSGCWGFGSSTGDGNGHGSGNSVGIGVDNFAVPVVAQYDADDNNMPALLACMALITAESSSAPTVAGAVHQRVDEGADDGTSYP